MKTITRVFTITCLFHCVFLIGAQAQSQKGLANDSVVRITTRALDLLEGNRLTSIGDVRFEPLPALPCNQGQSNRLVKVSSAPNWRAWMGVVDNQRSSLDCWAYAAGAALEGQLHISIDTNLGIRINKDELADSARGAYPDDAFEYMIQNRAVSRNFEIYPNLQGVRWGIVEYSSVSGVSEIKAALQEGPVTACFSRYADFDQFFANPANRLSVYHHSGGGGYSTHAVVIVGYDDNGSYWLCKNSQGTGFADDGYFRIGYGEVGIDGMNNCAIKVDQSCYAKIVPNLIPSLETALNYPFGSSESAHVLSAITISTDVTLPAAMMLWVAQGATLQFDSGVSLIVDGGLTAIGTDTSPITFKSSAGSPSRGDWGGIVLDGGPNSLQYCQIRHAVAGIKVQNTSTNSIEHCTIENCSSPGIFAYNTSKSVGALNIQNSLIQHNLRGVALSNARADLTSVILNCNDYQGLIGTSSSICYATCSQSEDNGLQGTYFSGSGSALTLGGVNYGPGHNTIHNNDSSQSSNVAECSFANSADGFLGFDDEEEGIWGFNNIYHGDNSGPNRKLVWNGSQPTIYAQFNYWGYQNGPPSTEFEGSVVYSQWLSSLQKIAPYASPLVSGSLQPAITSTAMDPKTERMLRRSLDLVRKNSDSSLAALGMISGIVGLGGRYPNQVNGGWPSYLLATAVTTKNSHLKEKALAYWYDAVTSGTTAAHRVSLADSLLGLSIGDNLWAFCQEKRFLASVETGQFGVSGSILEEMRSRGCDSETLEFLADVEALVGHKSAKNPSVHKDRSTLEAGAAKVWPIDLDQNYPNPVNPVTRITYKLKEPGRIRLVVYDALGRLVAELANALEEAGEHRVGWDGSNLGSGIYFARMEMTTLSGQSFSRTCKMTLAK